MSDALFGSLKAKEYFDSLKHSINLPLAANIARYHAKNFALRRGPHVADFFFEEVPNNGIYIRQGPYHIKVLKGLDGQPPTASRTLASQSFYRQSNPQQRTLFDLGKGRIWRVDEWVEFANEREKLNLIMCWHTDGKYDIAEVELMAPRQSGKYRQGVKLFWRETLPHPVTGIVGMPTVNAQNPPDLVFLEAEEIEAND